MAIDEVRMIESLRLILKNLNDRIPKFDICHSSFVIPKIRHSSFAIRHF
jgi:hypothetical protein